MKIESLNKLMRIKHRVITDLDVLEGSSGAEEDLLLVLLHSLDVLFK